jgi:hypothetical protein
MTDVIPEASLSLDPFALLGVSLDTTPEEVRQSYLELALIAHPDKGGSGEQMRMLTNAYRFVKAQVEAARDHRDRNRSTGDFAAFCRDVLVESSREWDREVCAMLGEASGPGQPASFHREFDQLKEERGGRLLEASLRGGYGDYMAASDVRLTQGCQRAPEEDDRNDGAGRPASTKRLCMVVVPFQEPVPDVAARGTVFDTPAGPADLQDYSVRRANPNKALGLSDYRAAFNDTPEALPHARYVRIGTSTVPSMEDIVRARSALFLDPDAVPA